MSQTLVYCRECREVHEPGLPCAEAVAKERKARAERIRRRGYEVPDGAPNVQTDENWSRFGVVEPGFNGGRPLESRAGFERERRAKGMEIVTVSEIKNARPRDHVREQEKQIEALAEEHCRA
jgi:hypothetical protein